MIIKKLLKSSVNNLKILNTDPGYQLVVHQLITVLLCIEGTLAYSSLQCYFISISVKLKVFFNSSHSISNRFKSNKLIIYLILNHSRVFLRRHTNGQSTVLIVPSNAASYASPEKIIAARSSRFTVSIFTLVSAIHGILSQTLLFWQICCLCAVFVQLWFWPGSFLIGAIFARSLSYCKIASIPMGASESSSAIDVVLGSSVTPWVSR